MNISELLYFALELARASSGYILEWQSSCVSYLKQDQSVVTDVDRFAEKKMRELIGHIYPNHGILGEEFGEIKGSGKYQWILDPIDGTYSYVLGLPGFGTLVGLLENGVPILGVIHLPATNETLYAETGKGCWYDNGKLPPVRVQVDRDVHSIDQATVSMSGVGCSELRNGFESPSIYLSSLLKDSGSVEFIGDCVQHMHIAKGNIHVAIDSIMYPWDNAAIVPCILEAGGIASTVQGNYEDVVFGGSLVSSCSIELHKEVLQMIRIPHG